MVELDIINDIIHNISTAMVTVNYALLAVLLQCS